MAGGKFREDLSYRLNVLRLELPPLRERPGDIESIARHFSQQVALEHGIPVKELSPRALALLRAHDWPGNVRELKNVVQRAALLGVRPRIHADDLAITQRAGPGGGEAGPSDRVITIPESGKTLSSAEAELVRHTLEITGGNRSAAARMLGISRPTLLRKVRAHGLEGAGRRVS